MLRALIIGLSKAGWAQRLITRWGFAWRTASRFVAGETPETAIRAVQELNARGILATMDHLGENTQDRADALQATADILLMLDQIRASGVSANVSIKLSQIGLLLDQQLCLQNLERILSKARQLDTFVRIDMEDSPVVDQTLAAYRSMRQLGYANVGLVIQAYLYRSQADLDELLSLGTRIRLVKGAYREPPQTAYPKKADVDANFDRLAERLIDRAAQEPAPLLESADGRVPPIPAIATHDPARIAHAQAYAQKCGLPKAAVEFQMLYGIRRALQEQLAGEGYPVRVYVPYGTRWYPYLMRRLAEHPANLWFFLSNFFRR